MRNHFRSTGYFAVALLLCLTLAAPTRADYPGWAHSGSIYLLTTPEGAALDPAASLENFPALVRLHRDFFDFSQADAMGADIRFSTPAGEPLAYEIEEWDAKRGQASVWVRIPLIKGNQRQEIQLHWGKPGAASESDGKAVFGKSNGYLSVWHMNDPVTDVTGMLPSKDTGTTPAAGIVAQARHFPGGQGIFCGDKIAGYPSGASPHSTEAWFRIERPNATIVGWGNEGGGRGSKVRMQFRSPPHIKIDSDFSDVKSVKRLPTAAWVHVAHTYAKGEGKIYINGQLDGSATPLLNIKSPARLWLGGWYNNFDFIGDLDEVRISSVTRSPDWVKLEFENQKPLQTLVGPVVQPGDAFSVSVQKVTVEEGKNATITARVGGALKVYWTFKDGGPREDGAEYQRLEAIVAVDRFSYTIDPGRFKGDQSLTLQFKAVYPDGVKVRDIPVTLQEAIPDPEFTLDAPATWDGRSTIEVTPRIANAKEMAAAGAGEVHDAWAIGEIAAIKEASAGKLLLKRAMNSGTLTVTATLDNGGSPVKRTAQIVVTEPTRDPWVTRTPSIDERPVDNQFYARDDGGEGTLVCNGKLDKPADAVFIRVFSDDKPFNEQTTKPGADGTYSLAIKLKPGLVVYRAEWGTKSGGQETPLGSAKNLVCGDAYLIDGQSNAVATSWGNEPYDFTSPWIRSFGSAEGGAREARLAKWGDATARSKGGEFQIGYWGMELARRLVEGQKMPICILNGAVGGTRIDQHQRSVADPEDVRTIYGRLLWRVRHAGLTHNIRAIFWHQGENDQGADGPTGGFGWETYRQYFIDMAGAWKQDYPNLRNYYVFQIWPKSCAMGIDGSDNRLREVQRNLPTAFSGMSIMSTLGIDPPGGCHYPPAGYAEFARLICPLVERDQYGKAFEGSITPPNLKSARYLDAARTAVILEFDQPVKWDDALAGQFYLDGEKGKVTSGALAGHVLTLKLSASSLARTITYLDSKEWSQKLLLRGENGIAALTFCEVPIQPPGR